MSRLGYPAMFLGLLVLLPVPVAFGAQKLYPVFTGAAMLHVDVPKGAMVTIDGRRTFNRSWSRYRHFRITGLSRDVAIGVRVVVERRRDLCPCTYGSGAGNCDCGYAVAKCCKTVYLRAGDDEFLCFMPEPVREKPEPELTTLILFAAQDTDEPAPVRKEEEPSQTACQFEFHWNGDEDGTPVRCDISYRDADFGDIDADVRTVQLKLNDQGKYPRALLPEEAQLAAKLHVYRRTGRGVSKDQVLLFGGPIELDKAVPFSLTGDKPGSLDMKEGAFFEALKAGLQSKLRKNQYSIAREDGRVVQMEVHGIVKLNGQLCKVVKPLVVDIRAAGEERDLQQRNTVAGPGNGSEADDGGGATHAATPATPAIPE